MSEIAELQAQIDRLQEAVDRRDLALKLVKNREFKKLILEDFCVQECARYVQLSADPNLDAAQRADALALAQAAGHLRRFLSVVERMGEHSANEIVQVKAAIEELRREEN